MEEENILTQELADKEEDARPDDSAIEIDLDKVLRNIKLKFIVFDTILIPPGCVGKISQGLGGALGQGLTLNQGLGDLETSAQGLMGSHWFQSLFFHPVYSKAYVTYLNIPNGQLSTLFE